MNVLKDYIVLHPSNIFSQGEMDERFEVIDMYDLSNVELASYKCMVILGFVDQDFLLEQKQIIADFLVEKKIVCFFGNLVTNWLPGQQPFIAKEIRNHWDYDISIAKQHPIFEGVTEEDMTINRGVKGFFARGHHPAPVDAEVLLTLPDGEPVTFIDRSSTNGTIFVHAGNNLFASGSMASQTPKTTSRIPVQLMQWVQEEYNRLQEEESSNA
uniref:phosphate starvation-inducible protein PhoH n=1 Tax=Metasolibacillus sp. FSL K6-0083 TaxID=2921416 RepID=UPI00406CB447